MKRHTVYMIMAMIGDLQLWFLVIMAAMGYGSSSDVCDLPRDIGPCLALFPRYYFNAQTGRCEHFFYGGCLGNANNFLTFADCWSSCGDEDVCSLPSETGPCRAFLPSYYFNSVSGLCEKFVYGGCAGNSNRFNTLEQCRTACGGGDLCRLPRVVGPCDAEVTRYYYNDAIRDCQSFEYGGCGGNANNFDTYARCLFQCTYRRF